MNETISILLKVTPEFAKAIDREAHEVGLSRQDLFIWLMAKHTKFKGTPKRKPGRPKGDEHAA